MSITTLTNSWALLKVLKYLKSSGFGLLSDIVSYIKAKEV
jgi:hypothetical protein